MKLRETSSETRININESWEMEWWPYVLGVSRKELVKIIKRVGPVLDHVKNYLSKKNNHPYQWKKT